MVLRLKYESILLGKALSFYSWIVFVSFFMAKLVFNLFAEYL